MKALFRLLPYLKPHRGLILISFLLAFPLAGIRGSPAPILKYGVDQVLIGKNQTYLVWFCVAIIGLFLLNFVVRFFHYFLIKYTSARVTQKIKEDLFEKLSGLSSDYFTTNAVGGLISRVGSDPQYIDAAITSMGAFIREPVTFFALLAYAFYLNWKLTLLTLIMFPPLVWVFVYTGKTTKRYITRHTQQIADIYSTLQEAFSGNRIIKLFQLQDYISDRFRKKLTENTKLLTKIFAIEEAAHPMVEFILFSLVAGIFFIGGSQVIGGDMTAGDLLGFFAAFAVMINPLRTLNDVNLKFHQAAAACDRIFEVFAWRSNLVELPKNEQNHFSDKLKEGIELRDVRFSYPDAPEREVLKGISFKVPNGQVIALVGASGTGKSSLAMLIPRIYDVTAGEISIEGKNIKTYPVDELRKKIAVVSQDIFLFNDTIEENIRCGNLNTNLDEVYEAAKQAHVLEFTNRLPDGLKTQVGERGQKLSGGEKQRVSIARAFLRKAPILILDEATSHLDSASERAVQDALETLMHNRTALVIAHRLSTIRKADEIIVMKDGQVVERGSHERLLSNEGEYYRFHRLASEL